MRTLNIDCQSSVTSPKKAHPVVYECDQCSAVLSPGVIACPICGAAFEMPVPVDAELPIVVYECDLCGALLPAGVRTCPVCGKAFHDAVPADAQVPGRGFSESFSLLGQTVPTPTVMAVSLLPSSRSIPLPQRIGILGAALLLIGVFTPVLRDPAVESINYFRNGWIDGIILVSLAAVSGVLALRKKYEFLWLAGALLLSLLAFLCLNILIHLAGMQGQSGIDLLNDPVHVLDDVLWQGAPVLWGWSLPVVGALMLLGAAARARGAIVRPNRIWQATMLTIFLALVGAFYFYTQNEMDRRMAEAEVKSDQNSRAADAKAWASYTKRQQDLSDRDATDAEAQEKAAETKRRM